MKACVVGGGSWGSAFALHLGRLNRSTNLWIRERDVYEETIHYRENRTFLPGEIYPASVYFFNNLEEALNDTDVIFIAVPSKFCRSIYEKMAPFLTSKQILVSLTKGIEKDSLKRMTEVMLDVFPSNTEKRIAVLHGPSFAAEVAQCHPTAVVVASTNSNLAKKVQRFVSNVYFRVYTTSDIIGVELAGAVKNVIAIATGISDGIEFGNNSRAALITRGLVEMARLGKNFGAKQKTFSGLAGVGDLVLTCTGLLSRNHYVGYELGKGKSLDKIISSMKMIAEGITTTLSVHQLAKREKVEMPICEQVYDILYKNKEPRQALQDLMSRKLKNE